jgi:hypothetical protein
MNDTAPSCAHEFLAVEILASTAVALSPLKPPKITSQAIKRGFY